MDRKKQIWQPEDFTIQRLGAATFPSPVEGRFFIEDRATVLRLLSWQDLARRSFLTLRSYVVALLPAVGFVLGSTM